jgi:hypothetical protein
MLSVAIKSIMLSGVMLNVIRANVVIPNKLALDSFSKSSNLAATVGMT